MTTKEAMDELFKLSNPELTQKLKAPYQTVAGWRFKHQRGSLSIEKQIELLQKSNYQLKETLAWKKLQK
jgi:hypothetical protein